MVQISPPASRQAGGVGLAPIVTLAVWRLRATWRFLLVSGIGMLAAVMLSCAVPLYARVALTAGLQSLLTATPQNGEIDLSATATTLTTSSVAQETPTFADLMHQAVGSYLTSASAFVLQVPPLPAETLGTNDVELTGVPLVQAASHFTLVQGRLPQPESANLELLLTPQAATSAGLPVGATLTLPLRVNSGQRVETLVCQVVGLFSPRQSDPFWHGNTFVPEDLGPFTNYPALMSSDAFLLTLDRLAARDNQGGAFFLDAANQPSVSWSYHLDVAQLEIGQLDDLIARLAIAQSQLAETSTEYLTNLQLLGPAVESFGAPSALERFRDREAVVQVPVTLLVLQILGLVLLFASLMAELLVERQAETMALLRSRGATRRQIVGPFVVQSLGVGGIAVVLGPALAIVLARVLAQNVLPPTEQGALRVLGGNLVPVALGVGWYALAAGVAASIAMSLAFRGAANRTLVDLRREAARSTRPPLWRRWHLDLFAASIALTGYLVSLYVAHAGLFDAQVTLLLSTPLAAVAPIFLVIAGMLLFLRCFPSLLHLLARISRRRPAATPLLALAQMARTPRPALRMILLLGLASSFAIFSLVFTASEQQRLPQIAAYEVGADFSGSFATPTTHPPSLAEQTAAYRHISGVRSASLGYVADVTVQETPVALRVVDSSTFAQTAIWTDQDSSQSLPTLLAQLTSQRRGGVPVIVDALAWERLHLTLGARITLPVGTGVFLVVVAEVQHLPTVNDSLSGGTSDYTPPGGMLLDYHTLLPFYQLATDQPLTANYVWLRTSDNPTLLAELRAALRSGPLQLQALNDRRALLADLAGDPLYLTMIGVLSVGAITPLLLALVGSLLASWLNAQQRLIQFAVLRALGSAPRQIASVLTWEQAIIYATALGLGMLFGALLTVTLVPALVFTGAPTQGVALSSGAFYALQQVLPVQIVLPPALVLVFVVLMVLCVGAVWLMTRMVSRPVLSQTLRLNDD